MPSKHKGGGCNCCCAVCTALFAENWAGRICLVAGSYTGSDYDDFRLPSGANASIADWIAAQNTYFNNMSITWTDTAWSGTYTLIGTYDHVGKACHFINTTTYNVWFPHQALPTTSTTWELVPITETRLTIGALWKRVPPSSGSGRPCTPWWFWQLSIKTNGSLRDITTGYNPSSGTGGGVFFIDTSLNADGFVVPAAINATTTPCDISIGNASPAAISFFYMNDPISGVNEYVSIYLVDSSSMLILDHTTGTPSLASC